MKNKVKPVYGRLYRSSAPLSVSDLVTIYNHGIRTIICLQEGVSWAFGAYKARKDWVELGRYYLEFSLSSIFFPSKDELERISAEINTAPMGGVLVHCKAGVDRTGIVIAYYSVKHIGISPEDAWTDCVANGMHIWYRWFWKKKFFEVCKCTAK